MACIISIPLYHTHSVSLKADRKWRSMTVSKNFNDQGIVHNDIQEICGSADQQQLSIHPTSELLAGHHTLCTTYYTLPHEYMHHVALLRRLVLALECLHQEGSEWKHCTQQTSSGSIHNITFMKNYTGKQH